MMISLLNIEEIQMSQLPERVQKLRAMRLELAVSWVLKHRDDYRRLEDACITAGNLYRVNSDDIKHQVRAETNKKAGTFFHLLGV